MVGGDVGRDEGDDYAVSPLGKLLWPWPANHVFGSGFSEGRGRWNTFFMTSGRAGCQKRCVQCLPARAAQLRVRAFPDRGANHAADHHRVESLLVLATDDPGVFPLVIVVKAGLGNR